MAHHARDIVGHRRFIMIERDELTVALECRVIWLSSGRCAGRPGQAKPRGLRRSRATRDRALERREFPTDMIENTVENDAQAATARCLDEGVEIRFVAKPRVDPKMIDRVVTV